MSGTIENIRMVSNVTSTLNKIFAINILPFLMSLVLLQACSPKLTPDSPMQEPEPAQVPTLAQSELIPPNNMYLFVEIWIAFDGTGTLPMKFVDFPGYEYDPATGELRLSGRGGAKASLAPTDWGFTGMGEKR